MGIHQTAVIDGRAEISESANIGPYVIIDGPVKIGAEVKVYPHCYLSGWTEIGARCEIHPHAVVGHLPQDINFKGERSYCRIGEGTIIREGATIHRGTQPESWTLIGKNCFLLAYSHVAHNCTIGDNVKLYNNTAIAGHAEIGNNVIVSAYGMVLQFCRIGEYAFVSGAGRIKQDLPPYMMGAFYSTCVGYNAIGLRRSGEFSPEEISEVREAYRLLFRSRQTFAKSIEVLRATAKHRTGRRILEFIENPSKLGIIRGRMAAGELPDEMFAPEPSGTTADATAASVDSGV